MKKSIALLFLGLVFMNNVCEAVSEPKPARPQFYRLYVGPGDELVATTMSGVFRSVDGGEHWSSVLHRVGYKLIAHEEDLFLIGDLGKRYRSKDFGATWSEEGIIDNKHRERLISSDTLGDTIYFCEGGALQISDDVGKRWREVPAGNRCRGVAGNRDVIYVLDDERIYKSKDRGARWFLVQQTSSSPVAVRDLYGLKIDFAGTLYAKYRGGAL